MEYEKMAWQRGFWIGFTGMAAMMTTNENHLTFLDRMLPQMKQPPISQEEREWAETELRRMLPFIQDLAEKHKK